MSIGGGNDTVLHLPNGDFEMLREDRLKDPHQLALMLEPGNFGRAFPYWQKIAKELGVVPDIRNDDFTREMLRETLEIHGFAVAMTEGLPDGPLPANATNQK